MPREDIDTLLRNRLVAIQEQGVNQSLFVRQMLEQQGYEQQQAESIREQQQSAIAQMRASSRGNELLAQARPDYSGLLNSGKSSTGGGTNNSGGGGGNSTFDRFMSAIQAKESGGSYSARNRDSGAMGKYQIMPGNIQGSGGWDKEALGRNVSTSQFMNSPEIQDAIARYKLKQYYDKYGAAGAAVAWYAGPGNAAKYVANGGRGYNRRQGNYPSVSSYAQDILRRMGR
jgi:hypothetical protein